MYLRGGDVGGVMIAMGRSDGLGPSEFVDRLAMVLANAGHEGVWHKMPDELKEVYRGDVRRVLVAAMEPTQEMQDAVPAYDHSWAGDVWRVMMRNALGG